MGAGRGLMCLVQVYRFLSKFVERQIKWQYSIVLKMNFLRKIDITVLRCYVCRVQVW